MWEPLIERVDNSKRRWNLELEVNITTDQNFSDHFHQRNFVFYTFLIISISDEAKVSYAK